MSRRSRTEIEEFQDYNILVSQRIIYYGSVSEDWDNIEKGTDYDSTSNFVKNLLFLDQISHDPITVYLNNPGGNWYHGMAVYDVIEGIRSAVTMIGIGHIMSMGTVIFQAAKKRFITDNVGFMIHDGYDGGQILDSRSFESLAIESKRVRYKMYEIYLDKIKEKHPKFTLEKVEEMCSHDKYLTPEQIIDLNLADKILK